VCEPPLPRVTPPPPPPMMAMAIMTRPQDWAEPARSILFTEAERARAQERRR